MKHPNPSIYEYNDFRRFITDFQKAVVGEDPTYTKKRMCALLGLPNSRSYLTDVIRGKHITPAFVERFIRLFDFDREMGNYFRVLVKFNQSENPDERELYFEQLIELNKTPKKYLFRQSYTYYKNWYNAALRALLNVYDFNGKKISALARMLIPAISAHQAREAFELLKRMGLIEKNAAGYYKPTEQSITTEEFVRDEIIQQFQLKCFDLARSAIVNNANLPRIITTNTVSVSEVGLKRIEKQVGKFRSQIRSLVHKDEHPAEMVYQMGIVLFPMAKRGNI